MRDVPYNPQTKAESFAQLTSEGMDADKAFVVVMIAAVNVTSDMADVRGLVRAYTEYTGQESLLWAKGER